MNMWMMIFTVAGVFLAAGIAYISFRIMRFTFWRRLFKSKTAAFFSAALLNFAVLLVVWQLLGLINAGVCLINVFAIWVICDLAELIFRKVFRRDRRRYYAGAAAVLISVGWMVYGYFNAVTVQRTAYEIEADLPQSFRIVGFSDAHIGAIFGSEKLSEYIDRMNAEEADIAVITGDLVDDDTSREEMLSTCRALSELRTTYGVYYVFGNHDGGYYSASVRGYTSQDLIRALTENGVTVLQDNVCELCDGICIAGRLDGQHRARLTAEELTSGLDENDYIIMLDHEPTDYAAEAASAADIVISGHTHGGQFFPFRKLVALLGRNELLYGHIRQGNTDFIVSSGIADWKLKFKTGCISEYFVIDVG